MPQEHKLITQFGGVETDSGSCLAFAPSVRGGPGNTVQPRDWQTPGRQSDNVPSEFVKLEPWAVPCANQWMKDNPSKWEGYSFYTWETPLERCATVVYSLGLQPVLAFVGGLEFDIMPSPIAEAPLTMAFNKTLRLFIMLVSVTTVAIAVICTFVRLWLQSSSITNHLRSTRTSKNIAQPPSTSSRPEL